MEADKGDSLERRVKGLPSTGCVLSRRQISLPPWQVFRWFFTNSSLVQLWTMSIPVPHHCFNQLIIKITEASNFHPLLSPAHISKSLLVLVSCRHSSFCRVLFCSPVFCCPLLLFHPPSSVSFPSLLPPTHGQALMRCMDNPSARSKKEQAHDRPPQPSCHLHPDPQTTRSTLKPKRPQHGKQGNAFPASAESAWGKGVLLHCCSIIRGQRPDSCEL